MATHKEFDALYRTGKAVEAKEEGANDKQWVCDFCGEPRDDSSNGGITRRENGEFYGKCTDCDDEYATFHSGNIPLSK